MWCVDEVIGREYKAEEGHCCGKGHVCMLECYCSDLGHLLAEHPRPRVVTSHGRVGYIDAFVPWSPFFRKRMTLFFCICSSAQEFAYRYRVYIERCWGMDQTMEPKDHLVAILVYKHILGDRGHMGPF